MALCFRILARPGTVLPNETGGEVDAFDPDAVPGCYSRSKALAAAAYGGSVYASTPFRCRYAVGVMPTAFRNSAVK